VPKKLLKYGAIVFLLYFVVSRPSDAAGGVRRIGSGIMGGFDSLGEFFRALVA